MVWTYVVADPIKTKNKIIKMINEAIKIKFTKLQKEFTGHPALNGPPITRPNSNQINIGLHEIIFNYDDVIEGLNERKSELISVTQNDVNNQVQSIILCILKEIF